MNRQSYLHRICAEYEESSAGLLSSNLRPARGGHFSMRASTRLQVLSAAFLIFIAGSARAQTRPFSSGPDSSAQDGSDSGGSGQLGMSAQGAVSQNDFSGSVPGKLEPGVLQLSLQDALARGLKQNLGLLMSGEDVRA